MLDMIDDISAKLFLFLRFWKAVLLSLLESIADKGMPMRKCDVVEVVDALISEHGFYGIIEDLLTTVKATAEISLADPGNRAKERQFKYWAAAVKSAIKRQPSSFDQRLNVADATRARAWGIALT